MVENASERSKAAKKAAETRKRNERRASEDKPRRSYRRKKETVHVIKDLLFLAAGYEVSALVDSSGIGGYLNKFPEIVKLKNEAGLQTNGEFIAKASGVGTGIDAMYKILKTGKMSGKSEAEIAYTLGTVLSPANTTGTKTTAGRW